MSDRGQFEAGGAGRDRSLDVSARVRSLIMAAEDVADAVTEESRRRSQARLHEAEVEAERRLELARRQADDLVTERRARISKLTDAIVERAERVVGELDEVEAARDRLRVLLRSLEAASSQLGDEQGNGQAHSRAADRLARPVDRPAAPEGQGIPGESNRWARDGGRSDGGPHEPPGLVARSMAGAGSNRGEVAAHLRRTFDMTDPHEILDEVFGPSEGRR